MQYSHNHISEFNYVPSPLEDSDFGDDEDEPSHLFQLFWALFRHRTIKSLKFAILINLMHKMESIGILHVLNA